MDVAEIGLRISEKAWRGRADAKRASQPSFVSHVCAGGSLQAFFPDIPAGPPSAEEAHHLAEACLSRFWTVDRTCTVIVTNIAMDEKGPALYLLRPPADGAVTAGYGTESGIPAFRCILRNGFFLAIGFEADRYPHEPGVDDLVLTGPVYLQAPPEPGQAIIRTRPPRPLPPNVLETLGKLESKRQRVALRVSDWRRFLEWQMEVLRRRQMGLRYDAVEIDPATRRLRFSVSALPAELRRFQKARSFLAVAMPLTASADARRWDPVEGPRGVLLGDLSGAEAKLEGFSEGLACAEDEPLPCVIEVQMDTESWDRCRRRLPEEGFLASAIHMSMVPLRRQREALGRLVKGEYANPRLADFLFDVGKARTPGVVVIEPDEAEAEHLSRLNKPQRRAVAKVLAAPDLCTIQGPPGTGKTTVIEAVCRSAVRRGLRVLIASQANLAVDNVLSRLDNCPEIRSLRIENGGDGEQAGSPLSESRVVFHWLATVRDAAQATYKEGEELAAARDAIDCVWSRLEEMVRRQQRLLRKRGAAEQALRRARDRSAQLTEDLSALGQPTSVRRSASRILGAAAERLRDGVPASDLGEWIQLIEPGARAGLFEPLGSWRDGHPLPAALLRMLPGEETEEDEAAAPLRRWPLKPLCRLWRWFAGRRDESPSMPSTAEPNWGVEWIEGSRLLGQLRGLEEHLPGLVALCEEAERLCAAMAVSDISEADWAKVTGALHRALKPVGGQKFAEALGIGDLPTSLRPKRRFRKRLATTRVGLREGLEKATGMAGGLADVLAAAAEGPREYLDVRLAETDRQIRAVRSEMDESTRQQEETTVVLTDSKRELDRLQSDWSELLATLPEPLLARAGEGAPLIGPESLAVLDAARSAYAADTEARLSRHGVWGPVQAEWIRLLGQPNEVDRRRLRPLYLKRSNVVGATCSYCGKWGAFLGREEFARFDIIIVDEVSKATPPELLLPALLGEKLVLVGDYRQLPPTFKEGPQQERPFGELAEVDEDFEQVSRFRAMVTSSLFKKLTQGAPDVLSQALLEQHRMHPQIMAVINQFYDNQLRCGIADPDAQCDHGLTIRTRRGDFLTPAHHVLWVDTSRDRRGRRVRERQVGTSKANDTEAECVARLIKTLNEAARRAGGEPGAMDVGVITFYGPQVRLIHQHLQRLDEAEKEYLDLRLNTVDGFQGAERSIVIVSLVRCKRGHIGVFARRFERINVAMSRARELLIVLGATETFANVTVSLPDRTGKPRPRRCYRHILDIVRRHGGLRTVRDLF